MSKSKKSKGKRIKKSNKKKLGGNWVNCTVRLLKPDPNPLNSIHFLSRLWH